MKQYISQSLHNNTGRHLIIQRSGNLHIADLSYYDAGIYQCVAYNSVTDIRLAVPVSYQFIVAGNVDLYFLILTTPVVQRSMLSLLGRVT